MREDYRDQVEQMFPDGCLVVYLVDDKHYPRVGHLRVMTWNPKGATWPHEVKDALLKLLPMFQADPEAQDEL